MKKLPGMLVVLALLFGNYPILAQDSVTEASSKMGLSFSFNGFNLSSFTGGNDSLNGGIGGKLFVNKATALVGGIGFNRISAKLESDDIDFTDAEASTTLLTFIGGLQIYLTPDKKVSPYLGGQVSYGRVSINYQPSVLKEPSPRQFLEDKITVSALGFHALLGAEYWMTKSLSLAGQYTVGWTTGSSKTKTKRQSETGSTTKTEEMDGPSTSLLGFGTSSLIMTIYF